MPEVTVDGIPRPKGSARPIKTKDGRIFMKAPAQTIEWQNAITAEVRKVLYEWPPDKDSAWAVYCEFYFPRPKNHYGTGKNANTLKPGAPAFPTSRSVGDWDKLARSVCDAMTGIAFADDSQIMRAYVFVNYCRGDQQPHLRLRWGKIG